MGGLPGKSLLPLALAILSFSHSLPAERKAKGGNYLTLDAGGYVSNLKERVTVPRELQGHVSSISGFVRLRWGLHLGKHFHLEPGVGLVVPWRSGADGNTKTFTTHLDLALAYQFVSFLSLRAGPGIQWVSVLSSSQAVTLNNGTSTATFYTPGGTANAWILTVQGALEINLSSRVCANLGVYVPEVGSPARRRYNGVVTLGLTL